MKRVFKAALLATTMTIPGWTFAQSPPVTPNACDQLVQTIDRLGTQQALLTRQQALDYQSKRDLAACNTALAKLTAPVDSNAAAAGSDVQVIQGAPQVTVTQQPATVTVNPGQAEITIHQPAPVVTVVIPPPDVTVRLPAPSVSVSQPQPQVSVSEAKPQVTVIPPQQPAATVANAQQQNPTVQFSADKAQVTVQQTGQPTVHVEQQVGVEARQNSGAIKNQQTAAITGQLQPQQIAVSDLVGKEVINVTDTDIGRITEVVTDAKNQAFAIVDKGGRLYSVDVKFTYMRGNNLVLNTTADPSQLPAWNESQIQSNNMHKLIDSQMVTIALVSG